MNSDRIIKILEWRSQIATKYDKIYDPENKEEIWDNISPSES